MLVPQMQHGTCTGDSADMLRIHAFAMLAGHRKATRHSQGDDKSCENVCHRMQLALRQLDDQQQLSWVLQVTGSCSSISFGRRAKGTI